MLNRSKKTKKILAYLHVPWIGTVLTKFEKQITTAVKQCFFAVEPCVIFKTRQLLLATKKGMLPFTTASMLSSNLCIIAIVGMLVHVPTPARAY